MQWQPNTLLIHFWTFFHYQMEKVREIKQTSFTKFHIVSFTSVQMPHKLTNKLDFRPLTLSGVHNLLSLGCITIHCALMWAYMQYTFCNKVFICRIWRHFLQQCRHWIEVKLKWNKNSRTIFFIWHLLSNHTNTTLMHL